MLDMKMDPQRERQQRIGEPATRLRGPMRKAGVSMGR